MTRLELLKKAGAAFNEIVNNCPYDLLSFDSIKEEREYLNNKTKEFDLYKSLLVDKNSDGIAIITEDEFIAVSPVFIHKDAFNKLFGFLSREKNNTNNFKEYEIEDYCNKGNILIRIVNSNCVIGCDSYLPEKINDFQLRMLDRITSDLCKVYKELDITDSYNAKNIKYGIETIRNSVKEAEIVKTLKR